MTRVIWDVSGNHLSHVGVDRGMLYPSPVLGVPWNGLVSVTESPTGPAASPYYLDGQKVLNIPGGEDFTATIEAFATPPEFDPCVGRLGIAAGLFATDQPKVTFGFSYRTLIGNDVKGTAFAYKVHLVYNALAKTSDFTNETTSSSSSVKTRTWSVSTVPVVVAGYRPTSHFTFDSRLIPGNTLVAIENILYGVDSTDPRIMTTTELATLLVL